MPFEDVLELLEHLEERIDLLLAARLTSRSMRQLGNLTRWLRSQPRDRLVMLAAIGVLGSVGVTAVLLTSRKGPKRMERRLRPQNKPKLVDSRSRPKRSRKHARKARTRRRQPCR